MVHYKDNNLFEKVKIQFFGFQIPTMWYNTVCIKNGTIRKQLLIIGV